MKTLKVLHRINVRESDNSDTEDVDADTEDVKIKHADTEAGYQRLQ